MTTLKTTVRLMMTTEPQEKTHSWKDKETGNERSRVRELLEGYLLGTGVPLTKLEVNINKYQGTSQFRAVKLVDLYKAFVKNEDNLKSGKKVLLAHLELIPMKNAFSEDGTINAFAPYLTGYDVADATEEDALEIEAILRNTTGTSETSAEAAS